MRRNSWSGCAVALVLAGCSNGGARIEAPPPSGAPLPGSPTPGATPTADPSAFGTLRLDGIDALGRAGTADGGADDALVGVSDSQGIAPLQLILGTGLALTGDDAQASVGCVMGLGAEGIALQAVDRTTGNAFFGTSDLAHVSAAGQVRPLKSTLPFAGLDTDVACDLALRSVGDGFLYALAKGRHDVWRFSFETGSGVPYVDLDDAGTIDQFIPLTGGHVLYLSTNAQSERSSWWQKPDGTRVSLQYPNVDILQTKSLGDKALTFAPGGRSGAMLLAPSDTGIVRSFVEPLYGDGTMTYWGAASRTTVGDWIVTGYTALKGTEMASNPFWRSYGRFQGLVDGQVYFDGSNLVSVTYDASAGLKVLHEKNIVQNALKRWKVVAVFGPAQGFTDKWVGFAYNEGFIPASEIPHMSWVEIDPSTGRVDDEKVYRMFAPHMYAGWGSQDRIPEFTPYRVPGGGGSFHIVGLGGTLSAGLFRLTFDDTAKTVELGAQLGCAYTYEHGRALLKEHRLLFTASWYSWDVCTEGSNHMRYVYFYDGDADAAATHLTRIPLPAAVQTILTPPAGGTDHCNAHLLYGMVQMPGRAGPSILACDVAAQNVTADVAPLRLVHFSDNGFSAVESSVALPVVVGKTSDADGDFATGTVNNTDWMQSFALPDGILALGFGRTRVVKLVNANTGATVASVPFNELWTENRFEYSRIFGHMTNTSWYDNEVNVVAPWDATRFFASDDTEGGFASYLVNVDARSFTPIAALNGLQVHSAVRVADNRVLVSAVQSGEAVTVLLDNDGNKVSEDAAEWVVREVAPVVR